LEIYTSPNTGRSIGGINYLGGVPPRGHIGGEITGTEFIYGDITVSTILHTRFRAWPPKRFFFPNFLQGPLFLTLGGSLNTNFWGVGRQHSPNYFPKGPKKIPFGVNQFCGDWAKGPFWRTLCRGPKDNRSSQGIGVADTPPIFRVFLEEPFLAGT